MSTQCIFRISCDRDDRRIFVGLIFSISGFLSPGVRYVLKDARGILES